MLVSEIPLKGAHNVENVLAAVCVGALLGCAPEQIRRSGAQLQGRRTSAGIRRDRARRRVSTTTPKPPTWTPPSRRSNPSPANIHLILGGKDKGSDYTVLNTLLAERVKRVYTIGAAAAKIESQIERRPQISSTPKPWKRRVKRATAPPKRRYRAAGPGLRQLRPVPELRASRTGLQRCGAGAGGPKQDLTTGFLVNFVSYVVSGFADSRTNSYVPILSESASLDLRGEMNPSWQSVSASTGGSLPSPCCSSSSDW